MVTQTVYLKTIRLCSTMSSNDIRPRRYLGKVRKKTVKTEVGNLNSKCFLRATDNVSSDFTKTNLGIKNTLTLPLKKRKLNAYNESLKKEDCKNNEIKCNTVKSDCAKEPLSNKGNSDTATVNLPSSSCADLTMGQFPNQVSSSLHMYNIALKPDEDGDFPLHIATAQNHIRAMVTFINIMKSFRTSIDVFNNLRQTPLHIAAIIGYTQPTELLLAGGASPFAVTRHGDTAFHLAVMYGHLECLRILVEKIQSLDAQKIYLEDKKHLNLNLRNHEGLTPLHLAVIKRQKEILEYLCENGVNINEVDGKSGRTPLFYAVENRDKELVELLIKYNADVNVQNYSGNDPLSTAAGKKSFDIVKLLMSHGAKESINDS